MCLLNAVQIEHFVLQVCQLTCQTAQYVDASTVLTYLLTYSMVQSPS